jgi:outer membrane protein assembly factor BamA
VRGVTAPHARNVVIRAVDLRTPGHFTSRSFDRALSRLSATQLFERATYWIAARATDTVAVIEVEAQPQDQVGLGFRFDDHRKAALLFTGTLHNRIQYGSTLDADIRLGEPTQFGLSYLAGRGVVSSVNLGAEARYTRDLLDIFDDGERLGDVNTRVATLGALVGRNITRSTIFGVRAGAEYVDADFRVAATDSALERLYYTGAALLWRDTFDRAVFPTRGISLRLRSEIGAHQLSRKSFSQHLVDVEPIIGLSRSIVARIRAVGGVSHGDDLPVHRVFFLGGTWPSPAFPETQHIFWGLKPEERAGRVVQVVRLSLQAEIRDNLYATLGANAGNTFEQWTWSSSDYVAGWAASLGMATPIGPVEVTATGRRLDEWPRLSVSLGPLF